MKTLKKIFNIKTIRNRIILIQLAVVIPAIVLLGIMIYQRTSSLLIDTNSDAYYKILGSTEVILRNNLEYYRDIARNILADDVLQKELTGNRLQESDSKMMDEVTFVKIEQEMVKYVTGFSGLQSIYIYDSNGKLFYIDYKYGSAPASGLDYEEMSDAEWFRESSEYAGYEKFVGYNVITEDEEAFSCIKQLKDLDTQEPIGMLVLNFDKAALNRVLPSYNNEKGSYAIVEKDGANYHIVAYTPDSDLAPQQITDIMKGKAGKYHLSVYQDSTTGWEFVYVIENQYIVKEAQQIKQIILDMLLVTTLILSIFTILLCNRITRPLYQLRDSIVRVEIGRAHV